MTMQSHMICAGCWPSPRCWLPLGRPARPCVAGHRWFNGDRPSLGAAVDQCRRSPGPADTWAGGPADTPSGKQQHVLAGAAVVGPAFGPGNDNGVAPGQPGTLLLAGHQDSHFAFVEQLQPGDVLQLQGSDGREYRYRIASTRVVDSRHEQITLQHDQAELRLVTCFPFASLASGGPLRYVVSAWLEGSSG